jgi:hypothetical protein
LNPSLSDAPTSVGRVVFDFDGTLVENTWPSAHIGKIRRENVSLLLKLHKEGREVIIYTARPDTHKARIQAWLRLAGLEDVVYDVVCGKPTADLYVDDKAYNPDTGGTVSTGEVALSQATQPRDAGSTPAPSTTFFSNGPEDDSWIKRMLGAVNG